MADLTGTYVEYNSDNNAAFLNKLGLEEELKAVILETVGHRTIVIKQNGDDFELDVYGKDKLTSHDSFTIGKASFPNHMYHHRQNQRITKRTGNTLSIVEKSPYHTIVYKMMFESDGLKTTATVENVTSTIYYKKREI